MLNDFIQIFVVSSMFGILVTLYAWTFGYMLVTIYKWIRSKTSKKKN